MFGKKREEYEEKIRELTIETIDLRNEISDLNCKVSCYKVSTERLEADLASITKMKDTTPEDCKPGEWCKACEFAKVYTHRVYNGNASWRYSRTYMCGKGESCKNFVQCKEEL